jgi:hypothetical protein
LLPLFELGLSDFLWLHEVISKKSRVLNDLLQVFIFIIYEK